MSAGYAYTGDQAADERRDPEEPELLEGPASLEERRSVLRAGFTEVLVTGMLTRLISVRHSPTAIGAKPLYAVLSVEPRTTTTNMKVSTSSESRHAPRP